MKRHWPSADLIATEEKARVAVSSRGFASAAAEGLRTEMMDAEVETVAVLIEEAGGEVIVAAAVVGVAVGLSTATAVVVLEAAVLAADEAAAPPKVNDWCESAELHVAWSMTAPLTVKQVPGAFSGEKDCGPALPLKGKSCESVTVPPESSSSAPELCRF